MKEAQNAVDKLYARWAELEEFKGQAIPCHAFDMGAALCLGPHSVRRVAKGLSKPWLRSILFQGAIRGSIPWNHKPILPSEDQAPKPLALRKERSMKLRIRGNSIRLRLGKSEVAQLAEEGRVYASIQFSAVPKALLRYSLITSSTHKEISAHLVDSEIKVTVPQGLAREWANSEQIGLKHEQQIDGETSLAILLEKDFHSLEPRPDEDQSDSFANPFDGKKHCNHP